MELIIISKKYGTYTVSYDKEDHDVIINFNWHIAKGKNGVFYARARVKNKFRNVYGDSNIRMHRLVMKADGNQIVDHIDHNGLNNCKSNLRFVTGQQSTANTRVHSDSLTGYKGVTYVKSKKLYFARIRVDGILISLGRSKSLKKAVMRYNEAALKYFGEFAYLNKIPDE